MEQQQLLLEEAQKSQLVTSLLALADSSQLKSNLSDLAATASALIDDASGGSSSVFLCGECSEAFSSSKMCNEHVTHVHRSCSRPKRKPPHLAHDYVLTTTTTGVGKSLSDNGVKCIKRWCNCSFGTVDRLQHHLACHTGDQGFRCHVCQEKFKKWHNCSTHLWKSHGLDLDLIACPADSECNYRTGLQAKMFTHVQIHSENKQFICSVCSKAFRQLAQLKNHAVIHMDKDTDSVPKWYTKKQCELCHKYLADSKCLKKHVQSVHSKLRPYICQVCNHQSSRKAMLEMHMRQHTGEKPFACDHCEYRTGDHNSLRRHKMRHTGQKPYRCPHCPYGSIQSAAYKRHLKMKHNTDYEEEATNQETVITVDLSINSEENVPSNLDV